ncbi:peptide deformylase [Candidatus Uhrbacteria bacterium]|nr:peptide deformylase [Candidatus Uhrbacteria bacterium]
MPNAPLTILTNPDPRLRQRAAEVDVSTLKRLRSDGFLDQLVATMRVADGVGIAATQVGVPHRIIVVLEGKTPRVYVNPEITSHSVRTAVDTEGCLSVPGMIGLVRRAKSITVRALDAEGKPVTKKVKDLIARIFQHEVDHLDGILYIDRAIKTSELPKDAGAELRV